MKEKILFEKNITLLDAFSPLIIAFIINVVYLVTNTFSIFLFIGLIFFSIIYMYLTRYNAVEIKAYEHEIIIDFFLIRKKVMIGYNEIKDIKIVSSGVYGGSYLMFFLNKENDNIKFKIKLLDIEFIKFLEQKTNKKIFNE